MKKIWYAKCNNALLELHMDIGIYKNGEPGSEDVQTENTIIYNDSGQKVGEIKTDPNAGVTNVSPDYTYAIVKTSDPWAQKQVLYFYDMKGTLLKRYEFKEDPGFHFYFIQNGDYVIGIAQAPEKTVLFDRYGEKLWEQPIFATAVTYNEAQKRIYLLGPMKVACLSIDGKIIWQTWLDMATRDYKFDFESDLLFVTEYDKIILVNLIDGAIIGSMESFDLYRELLRSKSNKENIEKTYPYLNSMRIKYLGNWKVEVTLPDKVEIYKIERK